MRRDASGPSPHVRAPRVRIGARVLVTLTIVATGCAAGEDESAVAAAGDDEDAVAACSTFQDHLESMRQDDGRAEGIRLAQDAADIATESGDDELAEALEDYQRVIVRFALAEDDREAARDRVDDAGDTDLPRAEDELADAEAHLEGLIDAGDLVLAHISAGCDEHGVALE